MDNDIKKPTPAAPAESTPTEPVSASPVAPTAPADPSTPHVIEPEIIETPHGKKPKKKHGGLYDFVAFLGIIAIAVGLALLLIGFVFRSYEVDGPSMQTTLYNQDKLIIWKVPRTWARITGHQYVPKRGDIIIFDESNLSVCGQEGSRQLIKRVIGLPGDRVVVKNGHYEVYDKANPKGFDPDQTLPYNSDHHLPTTTGNIDVTLSSDQLFVSGDNRPDSCDSRSFGPIQTDQVIGKLVLRLLPANQIKLF